MIELIIAAEMAAVAKPDFSWLAGDWVHCSGGSVVEERWLGPANGVLVGANLTRSGLRVSHEFFRIGPADKGKWAFYAQPGGQLPNSGRFRVA